MGIERDRMVGEIWDNVGVGEYSRARFKRLVKFTHYSEVRLIANIQRITEFMPYWRVRNNAVLLY